MIIQDFFLSILSKQVEHNKCPFLTQKVLVDLSISFRQIKHLNIGDINKIQLIIFFPYVKDSNLLATSPSGISFSIIFLLCLSQIIYKNGSLFHKG